MKHSIRSMIALGCVAAAGVYLLVTCPSVAFEVRASSPAAESGGASMTDRIVKTDEEWQKILTPDQFHITREKGTEVPFSGEYVKLNDNGVYTCVCCGADLFSSGDKFDTECGWPSFSAPIAAGRLTTEADHSFGMSRLEVRCARCDAHLGHVFRDGPKPTGLRFCINSLALKFVKTGSSR
ncbi:MAG TPA: peptide-methionine (R)-S-oxide reductase MsrB [Candidatus Ozemobacteraceae bacterium]|nr:peptide-methionine (R)-S-oxide reductase MsrB [Candidatus Ozemobacteraceae bacterium]